VLWACDHSVRPGPNAGAIEQQTSGLHMSARCTERSVALTDRRGPGVGIDVSRVGSRIESSGGPNAVSQPR
jgi:hypothetical protein